MRAFFRALLGLVASICAAFPAAAQRAEPARVGLLSLHSSEQEVAANIGAAAFRAGMQALGYYDGQNVILHMRHANGDRTRLSALAAELVAERVAVVVALEARPLKLLTTLLPRYLS